MEGGPQADLKQTSKSASRSVDLKQILKAALSRPQAVLRFACSLKQTSKPLQIFQLFLTLQPSQTFQLSQT